MIIKNNFDNKRALPNNDDYEKIGKGSYNIDKQLEKGKVVNPFQEIEENDDRENDDIENHDDWSFFR